jgi:hypothetical protein
VRRLKMLENDIAGMGGEAVILETIALDKGQEEKVVARFKQHAVRTSGIRWEYLSPNFQHGAGATSAPLMSSAGRIRICKGRAASIGHGDDDNCSTSCALRGAH